MAARLTYLYQTAKKIYSLKLVAGKNGLHKQVQWVHMIEDQEAASFLRGDELIFTTGIGHSDESWLLIFAEELLKVRASGLILNIGPYIKKIPPALIEFCRIHNFPLFTIPWEIHLVDVTRYFCRCIIHQEQKEFTLSEAFKAALLTPEKITDYQPALEANGFHASWTYCTAVLSFLENSIPSDQILQDFQTFCEITLSTLAEYCCILIYNRQVILIFANLQDHDIETCLNKIEAYIQEKKALEKACIGVGQNKSGILGLSKSWEQSFAAIQMANVFKKTIIYYNSIGLYKILLSCKDTHVLHDLYNETLGRLVEYDLANKTDYVQTLKYYLDYDASIQTIANITFVHRNTINYKLRKIKEIIHSPLTSVEDRLHLLLAYKIKDII